MSRIRLSSATRIEILITIKTRTTLYKSVAEYIQRASPLRALAIRTLAKDALSLQFRGMENTRNILFTHVRLCLRLLARYGATLAIIWLAGILLNQALLHLAVEIGLIDRMGGLIALSPVILLQLLVFVAMFIVLRDGLPLLSFRRKSIPVSSANEKDEKQANGGIFAAALLATLIPFYGYYAGWGFLSNTLRDYSNLFIETQWNRIDFSKPQGGIGGPALEVTSTVWVVISVIVIWAIRKAAKAMKVKTGGRLWPIVVVACEATWALLGLFVISEWQVLLVQWLTKFPSPKDWLSAIVPAASAQVSAISIRPVDWPPPFELWPWLKSLFWYAVLPLIWFNLGAIVYGHNLDLMNDRTEKLTGTALQKWGKLPKPVTDFIAYFWGGLVKRWHAVANGVMLAASAGFTLTISVIVLWRFVDWLGRWSWIAIANLIGPKDPSLWQIVTPILNVLFGTAGQPQTGVVVVVAQFCIVAAGLELAGREQAKAASTVTSTTTPA